MTAHSPRPRWLTPLLAALTAMLVVLATPAASAAKGPPPGKFYEYSFTFVNGQTISGSSRKADVYLADAGGTDADSPTGMLVHVSCSDPFTDGWGAMNGPDETEDSAWQIDSFHIDRYKKFQLHKSCGAAFGPPAQPAIDIEMFVNGDDADVSPGPSIANMVTTTYTYIVTNTGETALDDVLVVDDDWGTITCPLMSLAIGASMDCTPTDLPSPLAVGEKFDSSTVTATGLVDASPVTVTDTDPVHYVVTGSN